MSYLVNITSQGQISIPARLRRDLGLNKYKKAYVRNLDGKIIVEPVGDFLEMKGKLNKYSIKNTPIDKIIDQENKAVQNTVVEKFFAKIKRGA